MVCERCQGKLDCRSRICRYSRKRTSTRNIASCNSLVLDSPNALALKYEHSSPDRNIVLVLKCASDELFPQLRIDNELKYRLLYKVTCLEMLKIVRPLARSTSNTHYPLSKIRKTVLRASSLVPIWPPQEARPFSPMNVVGGR